MSADATATPARPDASGAALAALAAAERRQGGPLRRAGARVAGTAAFWYVAAILLVLAVWELVILLTGTADYLLPTPRQVAKALSNYHTILLDQSWVTLKEVLIGFGVSVVLGMAIAVLIAFSRLAERLSYPLLVMGQAVPKIALGPLFIVWFGFGLKTNVVIAVTVAIFPIIINTALGLTSIDPDMVRLGRSMGATRWRLFWRMRLPNALPSIFAGLKVGITLAVIGAVVGEFIVGGSGLGYLTLSASGNQNTPLLFACIVCLGIVGILVFAVVDRIERVVLRWHPSQRRS